jgi:hypothetical protein
MVYQQVKLFRVASVVTCFQRCRVDLAWFLQRFIFGFVLIVATGCAGGCCNSISSNFYHQQSGLGKAFFWFCFLSATDENFVVVASLTFCSWNGLHYWKGFSFKVYHCCNWDAKTVGAATKQDSFVVANKSFCFWCWVRDEILAFFWLWDDEGALFAQSSQSSLSSLGC